MFWEEWLQNVLIIVLRDLRAMAKKAEKSTKFRVSDLTFHRKITVILEIPNSLIKPCFFKIISLFLFVSVPCAGLK